MPVDVFAAVDAAATVEATATLGTTTPHMPPTSQSRSPQRRCRSTPWLPRVFTVTLASLLCQCITSVCSRLNRSSRFSTQELLPPSSGSTRTALTPCPRPHSKATLKANFPCRLLRPPVSPRPCRANCTQILLATAAVLLGFASSVVAHPVLGALFPAFPVHSYCSRASRYLSGNLLL